MFKNFDPFSIKRRKAERAAAIEKARQEMLVARKEYMEHRKASTDSWLGVKADEADKRAKRAYDLDRKEVEKKNAICPICKSTNRIHKFVRTKGELNGSMSGHSRGGGNL